MGHMKWISIMVEDGSYEDFKKEYIKCVLTNKDTFDWGNMNIAKTYGKSVVKYVDEYLMDKYNQHLESRIDEYIHADEYR